MFYMPGYFPFVISSLTLKATLNLGTIIVSKIFYVRKSVLGEVQDDLPKVQLVKLGGPDYLIPEPKLLTPDFTVLTNQEGGCFDSGGG